MLTTEQQLAELDRVVAMCKGTKLEGKEHLCIKLLKPDNTYTDYSALSNVECIRNYINKVRVDRISAVAIVDDTPIFLEEPFALAHKQHGGKLVCSKDKSGLIAEEPIIQLGTSLNVYIPIKNVVWSEFRLYKEADVVKIPHINTDYITIVGDKQVGGNHYKDKAIQPWAYMEANYTKEQFIGFLRGNIHKYLDRYKDKNGIEDLQKAKHYLEKLIEVESKE